MQGIKMPTKIQTTGSLSWRARGGFVKFLYKECYMPDLYYWYKYAKDNLNGKTVVDVRYMTEEEVENMGWGRKAIVIIFNDGSYIFPSSDDEGKIGRAHV